MVKREYWELKQKQSLPLEAKILMAKRRIVEFYEHFEGQVYVSFSGGKDSTVLLHLVRSLFPEVEAVYMDTGLEYPELRNHVKSIDNVTWLKPEMTFKQVVEKYGYPIISKEVANTVYYAKRSIEKGSTTNSRIKKLKGDLINPSTGEASSYNMKQWEFLLDAPFKIGDNCCQIMKKNPAKKFEKATGKKPFIGTLATESRLRTSNWMRYGCNSFEGKRQKSAPLSTWLETDILEYIQRFNLPIPSVYGDIVEVDGKLKTTELDRTGCMFCGFGCHLEKSPNRFQQMEESHPKIHEYCMKPVEQGGLGMAEVLDFIGVEHSNNLEQE